MADAFEHASTMTFTVVAALRCALTRAELTYLVSDGSSGMFAMRDLLGFLATPDEIPEPLESPGLHALLPQGHGGLADIARVIAIEGRA